MKTLFKAALIAAALGLLCLGPAPAAQDTAGGKSETRVLKLSYTPSDIEAPKSPLKMAVVPFLDKRADRSIGLIADKCQVQASPEVGEWIGRALYQQLKHNGYDVSYFDDPAKVGDDFDFIIGGEVTRFFFRHPAMLQYDSDLRVTFVAAGIFTGVRVLASDEGLDVTSTKKTVTFRKKAWETEHRTTLKSGLEDKMAQDELRDLFDDVLSEIVYLMNEAAATQ
ncbi:MAG: hypothetical protein JW718_02885 [Desulfovibrionaceae bacterium]|nr:hypothetical protein [Desulfovibrionaceae bacterium]